MTTSATIVTSNDCLPSQNTSCHMAAFSQVDKGVLAISTDKCSEEPKSPRPSPESCETRPRSAAAISPITTTCGSDNERTSVASNSNNDNSKATSATAIVSPPRSVDSSSAEDEEHPSPATSISSPIRLKGNGTTPTTSDDTEIKPISLDELDNGTENSSDQRIDAELVKKLSFGSDLEKQIDPAAPGTCENIPSNDCTVTQNDDCKEKEWAKKISVTGSSGNLIEDLECDDSSASSVTTIIDSEQSSRADVNDDLEDTFRSDNEEEEGESDDRGDNRDSLDPLHSKSFVIFGDDEEDRNLTNNKNNEGEAADSKTMRAKTSNINPMSGKRSLTDDMQEWKDKVLSSWTLTPPKKKKKYTRRKKKKTNTKKEHTYLLRRSINSGETTAAAVAANIKRILACSKQNPSVKKCRELQKIANYNSPGAAEAHREFSPLWDSDIEQAADEKLEIDPCSNPNTLQKQKSEIHSGTRAKAAKCLIQNGINTRESAANPPSESNHFTVRVNIGHAIVDGLQVPSRCVVYVRKRGLHISRERGTKRNSNRGLQTTAARNRPTRPIRPRIAKKKTHHTNMSCSRIKTEKQSNNLLLTKPSPKISKKKRDEPLNLERVTNGKTRIAKKFIFNPTRKEGQNITKIFFGTVDGKRIVDDNVRPCFAVWNIVYDDGDEEELDATDLKDALNLYLHAKHWDKNCLHQNQPLANAGMETPFDDRPAVKRIKSEPQQEVQKSSIQLNQLLLRRKPRTKNEEKRATSSLLTRGKQMDRKQEQKQVTTRHR